MSTIPIYRTEFLTFSSVGLRTRQKFQRISLSPTMKMDGKSIQTVKMEELSIQLQKPSIPQLENSRPSNLRFDRLQPSDQESNEHKRLELDKFVAREAVLDEEFWVYAIPNHYSGMAESRKSLGGSTRYVDNFKRKLAEQKFNAMKRRYKGQHGQTYTCVVTVKEERNVKRTMLKSVVGTLDLAFSICCRESLFLGNVKSLSSAASTEHT